MKATCPSCNAHLNIDDKKIPAGGARIKCPTCQTIFPVKPAAASGAVPLPGASSTSGAVPLPGATAPASGAVPLPGISAAPPQKEEWEEVPTRMQPAFIPPEAVPGATTRNAPPSNVSVRGASGAVPLPGTAQSPAHRTSSGAVPLPGTAQSPAHRTSSGAVPLPGITAAPTAAQSWEEESTRVGDAPIPKAAFKPPPAPPSAQAKHVDFASFEPTGGAVPLPGAAEASAPTMRVPATRGGGAEASAPTMRVPATRAGAVPLPGGYEPTHTGGPGSYEPTHAATIPRGAVPLPGSVAFAPTHVGPSPTHGAVPLPGNEEGYAATHVGPHSLGDGDYQPTQVGHAPTSDVAVPLPGNAGHAPTHVGRAPGGRGVPLPGAASHAPTHVGRAPSAHAVPLPGGHDQQETHIGRAPTSDGAVPLPGSGYDSGYDETGSAPAYDGSGAVPLPGVHSAKTAKSRAYVPGGMDQQTQLHDAPAYGSEYEPTTGASPAFADVPEASGSDFAEVPTEAPTSGYDLPPTSGFEVPAPVEVAPADGFDFSNLPSPAGDDNLPSPAGGGFELDTSAPPDVSDLPSPSYGQNLPSPAAPSFDFAAPPPAPVNPAASFGEVDLGGGDSLEFDPTSKPKADDFEADLSAPLRPEKPQAPADGLEMLSFIDDTAREAGAPKEAMHVRRFHIKRRSGKVFGPFEEAVVVKMLEDGQLLGNEEVSLDAESWHPIGAEPAFQSAIARLMEQPSRAPALQGGPAPMGAAQANRAAPPSMERLKQLYEGRMAAVAVVQGKEPVPFSKRVPLIVAGVLLVGIAGAGAWSSTTRYGVFGLKVLFPARVSANTEEFRTLSEAKKALLVDTFKGYKSTKELSEKLLRTKAYPEVRAVWIQSVYYLSRHYGAATPADLQTAQTEQENILLLGEKHVEVVKALTHAAMEKKEYDKALSLVASARARADNEGDVELLFLKAEAQAAKGQVPQAMTDLKAVLEKQKDSARALHALGMLHLKQKEVDLAAGRFAEAIAANPEHSASAVELAAIELLEHKNTAKGVELLDQALAEDRKVNLAPAELGRAHALKAQVLAQSHKLDEAVEAFEAALKADPKNAFAKGAYGALLVERHDYAKAVPLLRDASDKEPQNLTYIEDYLNSLIGAGKMDDATKVMKGATARFPGNARISFLSGRVEDGMDRTKQAEDAYRKAISADPNMVEASIALAGLYLRLHRVTEAKPQLEIAVQKAPNNALVRVGLGELALAEGNPEKANEEFNKAADLNPNLPGAFLGLSRTALARGRLDAAQQQAMKALKLDPKISDGRLQLGTALWKLGKFDESLKELQQGKEDDPRSVNVIITLGAVHFDKGDLALATADLLTALQMQPGNPDANFYMAKVKNKKAEHTQAIEFMKKALDQAPRRKDFHYTLGLIYLDARKGNEAVDEWKIALGIDPGYADALEALGRISLDRNRHKDAIDYFHKALDADPSRSRIHAAIGDAFTAGEQWQKAIDAYLRALGAEPGFAEVYPKLANAYQEKKKWSEAISWYRKATQNDPENLQAWLNLGWAYSEKKQKEEAIGAFEEFLKRNQDPKQKKEIEDQIYYLKGEH